MANVIHSCKFLRKIAAQLGIRGLQLPSTVAAILAAWHRNNVLHFQYLSLHSKLHFNQHALLPAAGLLCPVVYGPVGITVYPLIREFQPDHFPAHGPLTGLPQFVS